MRSPGLNWACGRGHKELVQLLLDSHARVDVGDKYGTTPLIWAARSGDADIAALLLRLTFYKIFSQQQSCLQ